MLEKFSAREVVMNDMAKRRTNNLDEVDYSIPYTNIYRAVKKSYSTREFDKKPLSKYKSLYNLIKNCMIIDNEKYLNSNYDLDKALITRANISNDVELAIVKFPDNDFNVFVSVQVIRNKKHILIIRGRDDEEYSNYAYRQIEDMFIGAVRSYSEIAYGILEHRMVSDMISLASIVLLFLECNISKEDITYAIADNLGITNTKEIDTIRKDFVEEIADRDSNISIENLLDDLYILGCDKMYRLINRAYEREADTEDE